MSKVSTNFLLMRDLEQQNILLQLSKDFRKRDLYLHFSQLYTMKVNYIKDQKKRMEAQAQKNYTELHRPSIKERNVPVQKPQPKQAWPLVPPNKPDVPKFQEKKSVFEIPKEFYEKKQEKYVSPSFEERFEKKMQTFSSSDRWASTESERDLDRLKYERLAKGLSPPPVPEYKKPDEKPVEKQKVEKKVSYEVSKIDYVPDFAKYMKVFLVQEKLKSIVEKKRVALIGPANYLLNFDQGTDIENYDIVIRFNSSIIPQHVEKLGKRTDVWIYNFKNIDILDKLPKKLPQLIFCPYPKEKIDSYQINKPMPNCPIEFIETSFFNQLQKVMNFEPNSALMTILILLRQNVSKLYVSGISFLYDGYYDTEHNSSDSKELTVPKEERNNFMQIVKKVYNANDKLHLDNTMLNLIYPNFLLILNKLFIKQNHNKLYSTLNYQLFVPSFQSKYNAPNSTNKIYVHFGNKPMEKGIEEKMHLVIQSIKPKMFANEVFIKHDECDYDDLDYLLSVKNKGVVYFSNNSWNAFDNMIPKKNRTYVLAHHCYVNGNIYGSFIKYIVKDFDINESNKNINMLYILFSLIYYGQKMIYVSKENVIENGLKEIINVMWKLNLVIYL